MTGRSAWMNASRHSREATPTEPADFSRAGWMLAASGEDSSGNASTDC